MAIDGLMTFGHHIPVVLDVETTGLVVGYHEVVQIAILPLDPNLDPMDVSPFCLKMKPAYPERASARAMQVNALSLKDLENCPTHSQGADIFFEWAAGLNLPLGKKMLPICHNAIFDVPMTQLWLGHEAYGANFGKGARCTMGMAMAENDSAAWKARPIPFSSTGLKALCKKFAIKLEGHHDALIDVLATAKLYKELLRYE